MDSKVDLKREKIDKLDEQILLLLNERANISLDIRGIKKDSGKPIFDPKREELILQQLCKKNQGPLYNENIRDLFTHIMKIMRGLPDNE